MSRQINLYIQDHSGRGFSALYALSALGVTLVVLLAAWGYLFYQSAKLGNEAALLAKHLAGQKNELAELNKKLATQTDNTELDATIAAMKARSKASEDILNSLPKTMIGGAEGYAGYMKTLARISENGLWLTTFAITDGGKKIALEGRALRMDTVLVYARRANAQMLPLGVQFTGLELTPPVPAKDGDKTGPTLPVVFKLF